MGKLSLAMSSSMDADHVLDSPGIFSFHDLETEFDDLEVWEIYSSFSLLKNSKVFVHLFFL